jgi:hypothetical protein
VDNAEKKLTSPEVKTVIHRHDSRRMAKLHTTAHEPTEVSRGIWLCSWMLANVSQ